MSISVIGISTRSQPGREAACGCRILPASGCSASAKTAPAKTAESAAPTETAATETSPVPAAIVSSGIRGGGEENRQEKPGTSSERDQHQEHQKTEGGGAGEIEKGEEQRTAEHPEPAGQIA